MVSTNDYEARGTRAGATLILAHGAGAGQTHPFMVSLANELAGCGIHVVTFDFPYMERGSRGAPDRAPVLEARYREVIEQTATTSKRAPIFIGGKSMGGRIATQVAAADAALPIAGIICYGYPLHPPGQPAKRRDAHLPSITCPVLVIQGSRDNFGTPEELAPAFKPIKPAATIHVIAGGDHSFKAGRKAAPTEDIARTTADWIRSRIK